MSITGGATQTSAQVHHDGAAPVNTRSGPCLDGRLDQSESRAPSVALLVFPTKYQIYQEVKRDGLGVQTRTSRFAETVASLSRKAAAGAPAPAYRPGKEGYADWVIPAVQAFKEHPGHDYRKLMDVLREMPRVAESLSLTVETLPRYLIVCARKQAIPMKRWRTVLDASVELYELGDVQALDQPAWIASKRASTTRNGRITRSRR